MSNTNILAYIFLAIIAFTGKSYANEIRFEHFDYLKGPIHNGITTITQDSYNQIWMGSRNGLCKYNGYDLDSYISYPNNPNSIPNNFIKTLAQDKEGYMWIGTDNGICRYNYELDAFERYDTPASSILKIVVDQYGKVFCSTNILYLFDKESQSFIPVTNGNGEGIKCDLFEFDNQNNLWVTENSHLICYDKTFKEQLKLNISKEKGSDKTRDAIISLYIDDQGNKWIGKNGNGIVKINNKTNDIEYVYSPLSREDGIIRSISQDQHGNMWFGTEKGILLYENNQFKHIRKNNYSGFGLNDNAIYCIKKDNQGNMWVGTYFGGINTFYEISSQFRYYNVSYNSKGLNASAIRQIIEDKDHYIWIASEDGGLYKYDPQQDYFKKFTHKSIATENIHSIQIDADRNLWIGTFMHGLVKYNLNSGQSSLYNIRNSNIPENSIFSLYIDHEGRLWIGTSSGLAYYDRGSNKIERIRHDALDNSFVYYLTGDNSGNIWIGLRAGGLIKYDKKNSTLKRWNIKSTNNKLTDNYVTTIIADKKGSVWFGTNNGGLYHLEERNNTLTSFLQNHKIDATCIYSITEDNDSNIWVTTNNGLYKIKTDAEIVHFSSNDGLPTENFNYTSSFFSSKGIIFAGTNKGLITFNPRKLIKDTYIPNIIFTNLSIGGTNILPQKDNHIIDKNINCTQELTISYDQAKFLGIEFAGVQTGANKDQTYQVFIDGLSTEWQNIGSQRKFIFPVLEPGKYVFKVRTNADNIRSLKITVTPPFYKTIWAYIAYTIIALFALYYLYKRQEKRMYEKQLIKINIIEKEKLREMNELRRNFFINISHEFKTPLSLIISPAQKLLNAYDMPEKAKTMLYDILNNSKRLFELIQELVNFNKMEITKPSLSITNIDPREIITRTSNSFKFIAQEKSIEYHTTIEAIPEKIFIDKSVLKKVLTNLLSNAFKFTNEGGKVELNISVSEADSQQYLVIKVTDTGIGISKEHLDKIFQSYFQVNNNHKTGWGIGLSYIKNLIEIHKGDISVESTINEGSCFIARINITPELFQDSIGSMGQAPSYIDSDNDEPNNDDESQEHSGEFTAKEESNNTTPQYEIMIVEDNSDMLRFLEESFSTEYKTITATNGKDALAKLETHYPDLIISDLMMPEINGLELCEKVKTNILTSHIPFILLTAKSGEQSTIEGYKHGADVYIEKPFNYEILQLQVKNILQTKENDRKYFKKSPTSIKKVAHNPYDEKLLEDIKQLIEKNIDNEDFSINDITESIGVSRTVLHVKFKKMLDMSVGDYIKNLRIDKAKSMLEQGYNISDTAYATGFSNPNYFSKSFKKETGQSPSEYIKNLISE